MLNIITEELDSRFVKVNLKLIIRMKKNATIDIIRFLAALLVALFHFNCYFPHINNWYYNSIQYGWLGVPAFFVISGYCVTLSGFKSISANDFIIRRMFRIFPPFWVSLITTFIVVVLHKLIVGYNRTTLPHNLIEVFESIFLLTSPYSKTVPVNGVYWSLTVEMFFYIIIYFICFTPKKFIIGLMAFVSTLSLFNSLSEIRVLFFLQYWPAFGIGASIYFLSFKSTIQKILSLILLCINSISLINSTYPGGDKSPYLIVTFSIAIIIFFSEYINLKENKLSKLGNYSFGVYLLHGSIGVNLLGIIKNKVIEENLMFNIPFDILSYLIVLFIAYYFYEFIERKSIEIGKKVLAGNTLPSP